MSNNDVAGATEEQLLRIPNLGPKAIEEIEACLQDIGRHLSHPGSRTGRPEWFEDWLQ